MSSTTVVSRLVTLALVSTAVGVAPTAVASGHHTPTETVTSTPATQRTDSGAVQRILTELGQKSNNDFARPIGSHAYWKTNAFIYKELTSLGWEVERQQFHVNGKRAENLIARAPGTSKNTLSGRFMVGTSYSTQATSGANNDSSSVAALLALSATSAEADFRKDHNLGMIAFWGADHKEPFGARHYLANITPWEKRNLHQYTDVRGIGAVNGGEFVTPGSHSEHDYDSNLVSAYKKNDVPLGQKVFGNTQVQDVFRQAGLNAFTFHGGGNNKATEQDHTWWGNTVGRLHDPCLTASCDTIKNVDLDRLSATTDHLMAAWPTLANWDWLQPPGDQLYLFLGDYVGEVQRGGEASTQIKVRRGGSEAREAVFFIDPPAGIDVSFSADEWKQGDRDVVAHFKVSPDAESGWRTIAVRAKVNDQVTLTKHFYLFVSPGASACHGSAEPLAPLRDWREVRSEITLAGCSGNASRSSVVTVDIDHTYRGDLQAWLKSPSGKYYTVFNRTGGSEDNIKESFTVDVSSEKANGQWQLVVRDRGRGDVGVLNSWGLDA